MKLEDAYHHCYGLACMREDGKLENEAARINGQEARYRRAVHICREDRKRARKDTSQAPSAKFPTSLPKAQNSKIIADVAEDDLFIDDDRLDADFEADLLADASDEGALLV